ncbi:MAG: radical SAM protein [Lentisphaerae bacterium]|nr:radical SAM protein [Lentisphaerota bacterium]
MERLDAILIAGDEPLEVLGKDERASMRLDVDGHPASIDFLDAYFRTGRDAGRASSLLASDGRPFLSLNGEYLRQHLESRGLRVEVIRNYSATRERFLADLATAPPRAVVISTTFLPFAAQIDAVAAEIKQAAPGTAVIAGGIQVWKSHQHRLMAEKGLVGHDILPALAEHNYLVDPARPSPVDFLIISEYGESTLADLLLTLRGVGGTGSVPNLARQMHGKWRIGRLEPETPREVRVDWARVSFPHPRVYVPIESGVGCGFHCSFCDFRGLRPVRLRSVPSVVDEIRSIPPQRDGFRRVYFTDDNLFGSKKRAADICRALITAKLAVRWRGMVRIGIVDGEIAELMARSGCLEILLGIESGDPDILLSMNKQITPDRILAGVNHLADHGINTKSTFIVGFPGETERTVSNTVDLLNAYPCDGNSAHRFLFFMFAVLPLSLTASPEWRERFGIKGYGYKWRHATMDSTEAASHVAAMHDRVRDEISPSYLLEVPELNGFSHAHIRTVYTLRTRLARAQRGAAFAGRERELWAAMESLFPTGKGAHS